MNAVWKRRRMRLLVVVVLAVVALVGTVLVRRDLAARRYAAAIGQLDRDNPYWRLDDLVAHLQSTPISDDENLAVPLAEVAAALPLPDADYGQRRADLVVDLVPNVRLTRDQWRVVIEGVERTEAAIGPALDMERFSRGRHTIAYTADGISTRLPHIDRLYTARYWLLEDLQLAAVQRGDATTALRVLVATLNLGRSMRDEPTAVSQFRRTALRKSAVRDVERLLGHLALTEMQLQSIDRELHAELDDDLWPVAIRGELAFVDRFMTAVQSGVLRPSMLKRLGPIMPPPPTPADQAADWIVDHVGVSVVAEHAELLETAARVVATARLTWPERWSAHRSLPSKEDPLKPELVRLLTPNCRGLIGRFALDEARVRCALAAIAIEQHRVTNGGWPKSLADLGPLPTDPFTGMPLLYKQLADGVVVYSVGPDEIDDGGTLTETNASLMAPNTDIGVRLWDMPHRNQRAPDRDSP
ncbi:MAG: hypothetical protein U0746_19835 [Gemmataceae bacterium]